MAIFYGFCQHSHSGLQLQTGLQRVQRSTCRAINLAVPTAARHFCSAKILAGGLPWGTGVLTAEDADPAQRNVQRKFALRRVGSHKFVVPPTGNCSKVRNHARLGKSLYRAAPGCQRDRGPFCFGKSPEEPLPGGSFGQLLRGGSTPRFFAQLRSVGSNLPGWQGTASLSLVPGPRVQPKSPPLPRSTAKPSLPAGSKKIAGLSSGDFRYLICCYMP